VNTGWTGGAYGTGSRMPIKATRALLTAALDGSLNEGSSARTRISASRCRSAATAWMTPARPAPDLGRTRRLRRQAQKLVNMFADNFAQYVPYIDDDVKAAAIG
jgi:phosphoenolpyruvate carboxykinase (ATP)